MAVRVRANAVGGSRRRDPAALAASPRYRPWLVAAVVVAAVAATLGGSLGGLWASTSRGDAVADSTLTFSPTADTYIRSDRPDSTFGSATAIQVDNSPVKHILLKFTVSGTGGYQVTSARLRLHAVDASNAGGDVRRTANASWSESSVTWRTAPAADGAIVRSLGRVVANTWYEADVTPLVSGDGVVSVRITSSSTDGADYASKERGAGLTPQLVVTVGGGTPPANTAPPTISGPVTEGELVTAGPGSWTGAPPIDYAYQWRRCDSAGAACGNIAGETANTYRLGSLDVGQTIRVAVTATNGAGTGSASSAAHGPIAPTPSPTPPENTAPPTITGPATEGELLTASPGSWSGTPPIGYAYQWRRCDPAGALCGDIAGETANNYRLGSLDVGQTIRVAVTATNGAGTASAGSAAHGPIAPRPPPPPPAETVVFGAAGDIGAEDKDAGKTLDAVKASGAEFFALLGDVSYSQAVPESAWCAWAFSHLGNGYPLQLVSGNHEEDVGPDGRILEFAKCAPDRMGSTGTYGAEYFFDRGAVRVILIAADLLVGGIKYSYLPGNSHYVWLRDRIREAKAAGRWVIVGMHKLCLSAGGKSCSIGDALQDLLIAEKVDLVLQGHDHNYQRLHSLRCANPASFDPACVADSGLDGLYARGTGTVWVIAGTAGHGATTVNTADPDYGYVATWMGGQTSTRGNGFLKLTVSSAELRGQWVNATNPAGYADSFVIAGG